MRRTLLWVYDACSLLIVATVLSFAFVECAYAYVDPSVMTYTIQALAGIAVALSTVLGVALRRTRKKIFKALGVDENARKRVEARVHHVDESGNVVYTEADKAAEARAAEGAKGRAARGKGASGKGERVGAIGGGSDGSHPASSFGDRLSWTRRLALSLVVVLFCGFTLGIVAPFEIVAGGSSSLLFELTDVHEVVIVATLVLVLAISLLVSFVPGKAFNFLLVFLFAGGLCCYVQAMFLNSSLPIADGSAVVWSDYTTITVISTAVWLAIMGGLIFFCVKNSHLARSIALVLSVGLIIVQGVGVASLFVSPDEENRPASEEIYVTEDGLYEVSDKENVIMFVLDRFDTNYLNEMLAEDPDLLDAYAGFTYFENHVGMMTPTLYAMPYLLTGELPVEGEDIETYHNERYARSTFLSSMSDNGYAVGVYSDTMGLEYLDNQEEYDQVARYTMNMHGMGQFTIDEVGTLKILARCALYRDMPWLLKKPFWFYTDEVNQSVIRYSSDNAPENTIYAINDPAYLEHQRANGLSLQDDDYKGAFRLIHMTGAHEPYNMNEVGEDVGVDNVTRSQQAEGALYIVESYMQQLKELGLYEDATIIVTSDHGDWFSSLERPDFAISPILLYKPSGADGSSGPIAKSTAPVSHADILATITDLTGGDGSQYGMNLGSLRTLGDAADGDRVRETYRITSDGGYVVDVYRYEVDGNVLDFGDWRYTGVSWHVNDPRP